VVTDVEDDAIDEAAASALPPITNALVLQECLPPEVLARLREKLAFLEGYVWFSEKNVNSAAKCCLAAVALNHGNLSSWAGETYRNFQRSASTSKPKDDRFFIERIGDLYRRDSDMYQLDRAVKAVEINGTGIAPQKYDDIPKSIRASSQNYGLVKKTFSWTEPVPDEVVDAVADFAIQTPPDEFWIADYVLRQARYDPVIYARFGDWHVEVARWD
jgi:hypothetical protein